MNVIGKPYSGKPNVRFDEGAVETEPKSHGATALLYQPIKTMTDRNILETKTKEFIKNCLVKL